VPPPQQLLAKWLAYESQNSAEMVMGCSPVFSYALCTSLHGSACLEISNWLREIDGNRCLQRIREEVGEGAKREGSERLWVKLR
jgi:hypothetical protein